MKLNNQLQKETLIIRHVFNKITAIFFSIAVFSFISLDAYADQFSVRVKQPDNQQSKSVSYFDLKTTPGQKQTLVLTVENKEAQDIKVDVQTDSATTSPLGLVDYSNKGQFSKDKSLKYDLKELLTPDQTSYIIPKNSKTDILLTLQMPDQEFAGVLVGGVRVTQADTKQTETVANKIAYEIGVMIREQDTVLEKELNYLKLKQNTNSLDLVFQNPVSTFINDLTLTTEITTGDQKQKVFSDETKNLQVAPNTQFAFEIPTPDTLPAGKYQVKIHASSEKNKWQWAFEDTFQISKQAAKGAKKTAFEKKQNPYLMYILLSAMIVLLLLIVIFVLLRKQNQLKKEQLKLLKKTKKKKNEI